MRLIHRYAVLLCLVLVALHYSVDARVAGVGDVDSISAPEEQDDGVYERETREVTNAAGDPEGEFKTKKGCLEKRHPANSTIQGPVFKYKVQFLAAVTRYGPIYAATQLSNGKTVAVKKMQSYQSRGHLCGLPHPRDSGRAEIQIYQKLNKIGAGEIVPTVIETWPSTDDTLFIVTEYGMEGTLWNYLQTIDADERRQKVVEVVPKAAKVLKKFHNVGYYLQAVSPNNIMVAADGGIKFTDLTMATRAKVGYETIDTDPFAPEDIFDNLENGNVYYEEYSTKDRDVYDFAFTSILLLFGNSQYSKKIETAYADGGCTPCTVDRLVEIIPELKRNKYKYLLTALDLGLGKRRLTKFKDAWKKADKKDAFPDVMYGDKYPLGSGEFNYNYESGKSKFVEVLT